MGTNFNPYLDADHPDVAGGGGGVIIEEPSDIDQTIDIGTDTQSMEVEGSLGAQSLGTDTQSDAVGDFYTTVFETETHDDKFYAFGSQDINTGNIGFYADFYFTGDNVEDLGTERVIDVFFGGRPNIPDGLVTSYIHGAEDNSVDPQDPSQGFENPENIIGDDLDTASSQVDGGVLGQAFDHSMSGFYYRLNIQTWLDNNFYMISSQLELRDGWDLPGQLLGNNIYEVRLTTSGGVDEQIDIQEGGVVGNTESINFRSIDISDIVLDLSVSQLENIELVFNHNGNPGTNNSTTVDISYAHILIFLKGPDRFINGLITNVGLQNSLDRTFAIGDNSFIKTLGFDDGTTPPNVDMLDSHSTSNNQRRNDILPPSRSNQTITSSSGVSPRQDIYSGDSVNRAFLSFDSFGSDDDDEGSLYAISDVFYLFVGQYDEWAFNQQFTIESTGE